MKKNIFALMLVLVAFALTSCVQMSTVSSLSISGTLPEILVEGNDLDLSDIVVNVNYTNGKVESINLSQAVVTGQTPTEFGAQQCTITYAGVSATFNYDYYKNATSLADLENGGYLYFAEGEYTTSETIEITNETVVNAAEGATFKMVSTTEAAEGNVLYDGNTFNGYTSTQGPNGSTRTFLMFSVAENAKLELNNVELVGIQGDYVFGNNNEYAVCSMAFESWGTLSLLNCVATDFSKGVVTSRKGELVVNNSYLNYIRNDFGRAPNAIQFNDCVKAQITNNTINAFFNKNAALASTSIMIVNDEDSSTLIETLNNIYGNTFIDGQMAIYLYNRNGKGKFVSSNTENQIVKNNEFINSVHNFYLYPEE